MTDKQPSYFSFNTFLRDRFGERVQKITLDAGLTCPNRDGTRGLGGCTYCDASGSGSGAAATTPDVRQQAINGMQAMERRYGAKKFIAYFQSFCNTYAPPEQLRALYDRVADLPGIVGLSIATRPDCLETEVLELLAEYAERMMVWLELGLQSAHNQTLYHINRNHTWREFLDGYTRARRYPLLLCPHIIIGLPGETEQHVHHTAREVAKLRPDGLKIHCLYIHKGTVMEQEYLRGSFRSLLREEFVSQACDVLELLSPDTVIQRLTGDPVKNRLVAPTWAMYKLRVLQEIEQEFARRGTRQGHYWKG